MRGLFLWFIGWLLAACSAHPPAAAPTSRDHTVSAGEQAPGDAAAARARPLERPEHARAKVPVSSEDPQWGDVDAPVTIVEFSDFECPFCARVQPTLEALKAKYGPRQLRLVWKHRPLPFHEQAAPSARVGAAVHMLAGSAAFFKYHDLVFAGQRRLTPQNLEAWAAEAGVSGSALRAWLDSGKAAEKVERDNQLALGVGASGTPSFRINGVTLDGAQPAASFERIIDQQLAAARALIAAGTPASSVYAVLTDQNVAPPPAPEPAGGEAEAAADVAWNIPVSADDPQRGPKDALITVVVFSEFQCPYCKRVKGTLSELLERYPEDLRLIWKDNPLPFHPRAMPAALLARQAYRSRGNDGFWRMHDALFERQPKLEEADLRELAKQQNLPWAQVQAALSSPQLRAKIEESQQLAQDFEARGTPHFFVNGRRLAGAQPLQSFVELIDQELLKARALLERGVPRAKVYAELMKGAQQPPEPERKQVALRDGAASRGGAAAPVVIQEFSDFQCPFCKRVEPTLAELEKEFKGSLRVVWRHLPLPFHQHAQLAAEAAEEVLAQRGAAAFWAYRDLLFEAQGQEEGLARDNLARMAASLGVDATRFQAALDDQRHAAKVRADAAAAAQANINGTPAFLINDYYLSGAQPAQAFRRLIKLALKERRKP